MSTRTIICLGVNYSWAFDYWYIFVSGGINPIVKIYTTNEILRILGKPDEYSAVIRTKKFGDKLLTAAAKHVKRKGGNFDKAINCFADLTTIILWEINE
jgi:hypothetical protein